MPESVQGLEEFREYADCPPLRAVKEFQVVICFGYRLSFHRSLDY